MDPDLIDIENHNNQDSIKDLNQELNAHTEGIIHPKVF